MYMYVDHNTSMTQADVSFYTYIVVYTSSHTVPLTRRPVYDNWIISVRVDTNCYHEIDEWQGAYRENLGSYTSVVLPLIVKNNN